MLTHILGAERNAEVTLPAVSATDAVRRPTRQSALRGRQVCLFGVVFDCLTLREASAQIRSWLMDPIRSCRCVVTPNVDHVVLWQTDGEMLAAYQGVDLVVADGWPVVSAARLLGLSLPERVAGSDLVPHVMAAGIEGQPLKVFLLGAAPGVAKRAAARLHAQWPQVNVVGVYSPPRGFETDPEENEAIVRRINSASPHLLVLGLGTPKQEIWLHRHRSRLAVQVAVAAGATIDFMAGEQVRAPRWMQRCCLEWFYRMIRDPKRLGRRYLRDAWNFPCIVAGEYAAQSRRRREPQNLGDEM